MLVVNLKGGLGNQLFQYALYTRLQQEGKIVFLNYSSIAQEMRQLNRSTIFDEFVLDKKYHLNLMNGLFGKIQRGFFFKVFLRLTGIYCEKEESCYDAELLQLKHGFLDGYWQTEKYFSSCKEELRNRLKFKKSLSRENIRILEKIRCAECAVSIHIRLGDYGLSENMALFGNICTQEYYKQAIDSICEQHKNVTFFVFSNEPQEAIKIMHIPNAVVVDVNDENTAWADMYLMSQCKHNIIANSSFSWWAAWLNQNADKMVIAPSKWLNGKQTPDVWPEGWHRI